MASATGMTTRRGTKRNNSGDTIEVKQKVSTITISDNSGNEGDGGRVMRSTRKSTSTSGTNRPWGRKGKVSVPRLVYLHDAYKLFRHQSKNQSSQLFQPSKSQLRRSSTTLFLVTMTTWKSTTSVTRTRSWTKMATIWTTMMMPNLSSHCRLRPRRTPSRASPTGRGRNSASRCASSGS